MGAVLPAVALATHCLCTLTASPHDLATTPVACGEDMQDSSTRSHFVMLRVHDSVEIIFLGLAGT